MRSLIIIRGKKWFLNLPNHYYNEYISFILIPKMSYLVMGQYCRRTVVGICSYEPQGIIFCRLAMRNPSIHTYFWLLVHFWTENRDGHHTRPWWSGSSKRKPNKSWTFWVKCCLEIMFSKFSGLTLLHLKVFGSFWCFSTFLECFNAFDE